MKTRNEFLSRLELKRKFGKGKLPTAAAFEQLIDSMVNKIDDGFAKGEDYGLALGPEGEDKKLMSFFENVQERKVAWKLSLSGEDNKKGLEFAAPAPKKPYEETETSNGKTEEEEPVSRFFIRQDGNIGVGNNEPEVSLDVAGTVGMQARIGLIGVKKRLQISKKIVGDGKWHAVLALTDQGKSVVGNDLIDTFNKDEFHAFEIMASVFKKIPGPKNALKQAMLRAVAMSCSNGEGTSIEKNATSSGWSFLNALQIRWKRIAGNEEKKIKSRVELQIRTITTYGVDNTTQEYPPIRYHITRLWDSQVFND